MKKVIIDLNDDLFNNVTNILDDIGMDAQTAVRMLFKKIEKENNINFLMTTSKFNTPTYNEISNVEHHENDNIASKMVKSKAKALFRSNGYTLMPVVSFSSKNKGSNYYWSNPDFECLSEDWSLILNDWVNKKLYLFNIPADSIYRYELSPRGDNEDLIDLQIHFEDTTFTDSRSGYSFLKYYVAKLDY